MFFLKLGNQVHEKKYLDLRKVPSMIKERDVIEKHLKYIRIGKPTQFMSNRIIKKLFDIEDMDNIAKKVLMVLNSRS